MKKTLLFITIAVIFAFVFSDAVFHEIANAQTSTTGKASPTPTVSVVSTSPTVKPTPPTINDDDEVIRVDTELVNLNIRVVDRNNRPINNLQQKEFKIYRRRQSSADRFFLEIRSSNQLCNCRR